MTYLHPFTGRPLPANARRDPPAMRELTDDDITHAWLRLGERLSPGSVVKRVLVIDPSGKLRVLSEQQAETAPPRIRVVGTYTCAATLDAIREDVRAVLDEIRTERLAWDEAQGAGMVDAGEAAA